jgi:hypothetical protein
VSREFAAELNRLANGGAYRPPSEMRDVQGAANEWAGTQGVDLLGALNGKAGTAGLGLDAVCAKLAGLTGRSAPAALRRMRLPPKVAKPSAATAGVGTVNVSFSPVTATPPVTEYTVVASPGDKAATGTSSPLVISGLSSLTTYTFTVTAKNLVGLGPASDASDGVTVL